MAQQTTSSIDVELPVDIFDVQVNIALIHQVVVAQLAAARQGTHSTKTRAEVAGGGKKPYRQKGTGRARQGSIRAPQYAGGGIVHGPKPRNYDQRTPKKMKAAALRGALSDRVRNGRVHVVESLVDDKTSTKQAIATVRELTQRPRVLVVVDRDDKNTVLSLRNVSDMMLLTFDQLNTYDVLKSDDVVFTKAAYDAFVAARSTEGSATITLSSAATEADAKPAQSATSKPKADSKPKAGSESKAGSEPKEGTPKKSEPATEAAKTVEAAEDEVKGVTKTQPYGPGSKAPLKSGNAPKGFDIKGNADSMKYHGPDSQWYEQTEAEVWFDSVESAEAAGFSAPGDAAGANGKEA